MFPVCFGMVHRSGGWLDEGEGIRGLNVLAGDLECGQHTLCESRSQEICRHIWVHQVGRENLCGGLAKDSEILCATACSWEIWEPMVHSWEEEG